MPNLIVPFYKQAEKMYCYPTCVKMVLEYAIKELKIKQKKLSVKKIARTLNTGPLTGTAPGSVELINSLLGDSKPPILFKSKLAGNITDVKDELDNKRPLIAWINISGDEGDPVWHTVVIIRYDEEKRVITYVDPLKNVDDHEVTEDSGFFMDVRLGSRRHIIKLVLVSEAQKTLIGILKPIEKQEEDIR